MKLQEIDAPDFDLARTLDSGQVFHWEKRGDGFAGTIGEKGVYAEQRRKLPLFQPARRAEVIANYFALDHPLTEICPSFPRRRDHESQRAIFAAGLRIIRQPNWECLATFITSSMKQVAHIRQISQALARSIREAPTHSAVSSCTPFQLRDRIAKLTEAGLAGLRAWLSGEEPARNGAPGRLRRGRSRTMERALPDDRLRARLCELPGVGAKVANCVMLFAYERLRAFPIDVWIERVLKQKYFPRKRKVTATQLRDFCETYFGEHGGYAQQYLFHHARKGGVRPRADAK